MGKKRGEKVTSSSGSDLKSEQKIPSQAEVKALINSIEDMRDKLCIGILYETGCLLGELVNIKVSDVNGQNILISNSELNVSRSVMISSNLANQINLYIQGNGLKKEHHLFSTQKSNQISVKRTRELIQQYSDRFGFGKLNPQMFRYYHIAHAYLNGVFSENISLQLAISRFRVFQILEELGVSSKENKYDYFLQAQQREEKDGRN